MDQDRLADMSGRLGWWTTALEVFSSHSLPQQMIGLGFYDANRGILSELLGASGASTLHSDYIDSLISTGWIGLAVLAFTVVIYLSRSLSFCRRERSVVGEEVLGISIILLARSLTGPTLSTYTHFLILFATTSILITYCGHEKFRAPLRPGMAR